MQPVRLSGSVTPFKGNGRQLGYPTANIKVETDLTDGVYFGFADLDAYTQQPALVFIGVPTTMGDDERRVEVHVLDIPDNDYYDQMLNVVITRFHRPNQKFDSVAELLTVMHGDEAAGRAWLGSNPLASHDNSEDT